MGAHLQKNTGVAEGSSSCVQDGAASSASSSAASASAFFGGAGHWNTALLPAATSLSALAAIWISTLPMWVPAAKKDATFS